MRKVYTLDNFQALLDNIMSSKREIEDNLEYIHQTVTRFYRYVDLLGEIHCILLASKGKFGSVDKQVFTTNPDYREWKIAFDDLESALVAENNRFLDEKNNLQSQWTTLTRARVSLANGFVNVFPQLIENILSKSIAMEEKENAIALRCFGEVLDESIESCHSSPEKHMTVSSREWNTFDEKPIGKTGVVEEESIDDDETEDPSIDTAAFNSNRVELSRSANAGLIRGDIRDSCADHQSFSWNLVVPHPTRPLPDEAHHNRVEEAFIPHNDSSSMSSFSRHDVVKKYGYHHQHQPDVFNPGSFPNGSVTRSRSFSRSPSSESMNFLGEPSHADDPSTPSNGTSGKDDSSGTKRRAEPSSLVGNLRTRRRQTTVDLT